MTFNSPGGSTLQCGRWIWADMPLNSPKRPPYWNSTSGFDFYHITAIDMSFCTTLRNCIQKKITSCRCFTWRISAILDCRDPIMGSLKAHVRLPLGHQYRHRTALNCLVFENIVFLHFGVKVQDGGSAPSSILGPIVYGLSNGAIFNDLQRPLHPVSRSRYSLTLNIWETVRHTDIVSMDEY